MPTNLPPEYFDADELYRQAKDPAERIARLEELISTIPKHKGTDKLRADLRRKLSRMKETRSAKAKAGRHESPYHIEREGAGQVIVIGPANTGKSSLVRAVTNAQPEVEDYPFSTWGPTPGMLQIENVQVQLIDTPAIDREFVEPDHVDLIRRSDLGLLVVDLQDFPLEQVEATIEFLMDHGIYPEDSPPRDVERGVRLLPILLAVNKVDGATHDEDFEVFLQLMGEGPEAVAVSARTGRQLDALGWAIFRKLEIIRVYSKAPGEEPDRTSPFVLPIGSSVEDFAARVHQDFARGLKSARIWGSGEFDGQLVAREHVLEDEDVVELRL
jgi:ribosome-interacting GTPase 1